MSGSGALDWRTAALSARGAFVLPGLPLDEGFGLLRRCLTQQAAVRESERRVKQATEARKATKTKCPACSRYSCIC